MVTSLFSFDVTIHHLRGPKTQVISGPKIAVIYKYFKDIQPDYGMEISAPVGTVI